VSTVEIEQRPPLVSVVIAAYQAERTIARAINSLLAQTVTDWEAIVVDDASVDGTVEVAKGLAANDQRIRVICAERNGGPAVARNQGIKSANGHWITTLDADDVYTTTRLEKLLDLASTGNWDLLFDNISSLPGAAGSMRPYWPKWKKMSQTLSLAEMLQGCSGVMKNTYGVLKPFVRRSFVEKVGASYDETLRRGEDVFFHISLMLQGAKTGRVVQIGYLYEIPAANRVSASVTNLQHSHVATLKIRDAGWSRMSSSEKFWLNVRFLNTTQPELWKAFGCAMKDKRIWKATTLALSNPAILLKVFVAKPLKLIFSLMSK